MFDFICALLTGIGIVAASFAIGSAIADLYGKFKSATKKRNERIDKLVATIERTEANTRSNPDQA